MELPELLVKFTALGGVGALIAALINILKTIGWIKDGQAPTVSTGLGLLCLAGLFALQVFKPDADIAGMNQTAKDLAFVLVTVFGFIWQLISTRLSHNALKGAPVLGKSYSATQSAVEMVKAKAYQDEMLRNEYEG